MAGFQVTKYDPRFRRRDGTYGRDEWIGVGHVGKEVGGKVVELSEYLRSETGYVKAVRAFMQAAHVRRLRAVDLEDHPRFIDFLPPSLRDETRERRRAFLEARHLSGSGVDWAVRLALRNIIWCRLEGARGFYVHFGHDFYMFVGGETVKPTPPAMPPGIFAEEFESPVHREDDE